MGKHSKYQRNVKNFGFNTNEVGKSSNFGYLKTDQKAVAQNLQNYLTPIQLSRLRVDIKGWREAIMEAERAYYPFRVRMQRIFIDTVLNGHVYGLMQRRKDLTLLRSFEIVDQKNVKSEVLTEALMEQDWFGLFQEYALDALFFGYSLISLGDIVNSEMQDVTLIPRWFISPDRHEVSSYIYGTSGIDFRNGDVNDWHVYCKAPSDNGVSPAGYGLMYNIALYEIYLRNTLGYNADFVELFAMPYRVGKTTKTTETERATLEAAVRNMGSAGYAIIDPQDEIEFLETRLGGEGYKGYESFEKRCQDMVATIILGHADGVSSTPGKLGASQKGGQDQSPVTMALMDKQTRDGRFMMPIINKELAPRLRKKGLTDIFGPDGYKFRYKNDDEDETFRKREDESNLQTAQIAVAMSQSGLQMDPAYFQERTGIPTSAKPLPAPPMPGGPAPDDQDKSKKLGGKSPDRRDNTKVQDRLKTLYHGRR